MNSCETVLENVNHLNVSNVHDMPPSPAGQFRPMYALDYCLPGHPWAEMCCQSCQKYLPRDDTCEDINEKWCQAWLKYTNEGVPAGEDFGKQEFAVDKCKDLTDQGLGRQCCKSCKNY